MTRRSGGGSCIAIRTAHLISSRFHHASAASFSDPAVCGGSTWMRKGLPCVCFNKKASYARIYMNVTPFQEERLRRLKNRTKVYFDATRLEHQEALRALWSSSFPGQELHGLISEEWKKNGMARKRSINRFQGSWIHLLGELALFAKTFSISFQHLLKKQGARGIAWEYPFAAAGVNITFMLMKMLDLDTTTKPRTLVSAVFVHILSENEWAFDLLYCVAFVVMDKKWMEKNATYMEFNDVLKSTRAQLEKELLLDDVLRIEDMPSFRLLH